MNQTDTLTCLGTFGSNIEHPSPVLPIVLRLETYVNGLSGIPKPATVHLSMITAKALLLTRDPRPATWLPHLIPTRLMVRSRSKL